MQILEINRSGIALSLHKGFIQVQGDGFSQKHPLDLLDLVMINSFGAKISSQLIIKLCEMNIPLIVCGKNAIPIGILSPSSQNIFRKTRIETQLAASLPLQKNLWKSIVHAKISNQALLLKLLNNNAATLPDIAKKVSSGDKANCEAHAARIYWPLLFGKSFRRNPDLEGINSYLNYAYSILRACCCRQIAARGLLPELGIHHSNKMNPFCLADDLLEPFRPFADALVYQLTKGEIQSLQPESKRKIIAALERNIFFDDKNQSIANCIAISTQKLVDSYAEAKNLLCFPKISAQWLQNDVDDGDV